MKHRIRFKSGISALLFGALLMLIDPLMMIPCLIAAGIHECGHFLFAYFLRIPIREFKLDLLGAHLSLSSAMISYKAEFFLCAAGPLFSFLFAEMIGWLHPMLALRLPPAVSAFLSAVEESSRFLGALNLIPVKGFDGARMLSAFLSSIFSAHAADCAIRLFTGIFLILLWGISVYLLLLTESGLILFVFSFVMFCKIRFP